MNWYPSRYGIDDEAAVFWFGFGRMSTPSTRSSSRIW
jgi:hypothetical protein